MANSRDLELRLQIGRTVVALVCPSKEYAQSMADYFGVLESDTQPQVRLCLELDSDTQDRPIPNSLYAHKKLTDDGFIVGNGLIHGTYDSDTGQGHIRVHGLLTKGLLVRVFEQFLYQAFYSARKRVQYDGFLIHSSGVIRRTGSAADGFLFVGPSEAGKSTVAALSQDHVVVNDEIDLVDFTDQACRLQGTPFNGLFPGKDAQAAAPLRAVFLLQQGAEHRLDPVGRAAAVGAVAAQIVPPVAIDEVMDASVRGEILELADKLCTSVPVLNLTFRKDAGFWQIIDAAFPAAV